MAEGEAEDVFIQYHDTVSLRLRGQDYHFCGGRQSITDLHAEEDSAPAMAVRTRREPSQQILST